MVNIVSTSFDQICTLLYTIGDTIRNNYQKNIRIFGLNIRIFISNVHISVDMFISCDLNYVDIIVFVIRYSLKSNTIYLVIISKSVEICRLLPSLSVMASPGICISICIRKVFFLSGKSFLFIQSDLEFLRKIQ